MLLCMAYHYVRPDFSAPFPAIFGITPAQLRAQLETMGRLGTFVSQADVLCAARGGQPLPETAWLVTFDDGLREHYVHAWPVLREMGIPAIFLANTEALVGSKLALVHKIHLLRSRAAPEQFIAAIDEVAARLSIRIPEVDPARAARQYRYDDGASAQVKYLLNFALPDSDREAIVAACFAELIDGDEAAICSGLHLERGQLREFAAAGCLGSHAHTHRPLGSLPDSEIAEEISVSKALLEEWTGTPIASLAYPYGSLEACPERAGEIAAAAGMELGFTMERAVIAAFDEPMFLPRYAPNDLENLEVVVAAGNSPVDRLPLPSWHRNQLKGLAESHAR